jgi:hypothetical protein
MSSISLLSQWSRNLRRSTKGLEVIGTSDWHLWMSLTTGSHCVQGSCVLRYCKLEHTNQERLIFKV